MAVSHHFLCLEAFRHAHDYVREGLPLVSLPKLAVPEHSVRMAESFGLRTSQSPIDQWHIYINEHTLADAILDRLVHNSYRVNLSGSSMRKHKAHNPSGAILA